MVKMRQMLSSNCSIVSELPTASRHSKQQQSQQQQQQQPTSKIRKSESSSKSTLADGTEISESSILESHPDGSSVETTTQIKVSSVIKTKYNKRTGKEVQVEETLTVETVTRREQRLLTTANPELDKQQRQEEEVENEDENEVALNILSSFSCKQDTTNIAAIQEGCEGKGNNNDTTAAIPTNENSRSSSSSCYSPTSFFRKTHPAVSSNANTSSSNGLIANQAADTATGNSRSVSFDIHDDQHQQHQQHHQHQSSKLTIVRGPSSSASPSSSQQPHLTNANTSTSMPPALPNLPSNSSNSDKSNKSNKSSKDNNHNTNKNAAAPSLLLRPPSSSNEPIKSKSTNKLSNKQAPPSPKSAPTPQPKPTPTPTPTTMSSSKALVKYDHKPLLTQDADFATPQVTISGDNAVVTDDSCIHFFSFHHTSNNSNNNTKTAKTAAIGKWVHSTTVAIENTYCINVALSSTSNTCIVGVPYDKNTKGLLTGAAYIFEKDEVKGTWFQIKKIIPKQEVMQVAAGVVTPNNALNTTNANGGEFATIGYSVGIDGDTIVVGVPHVGNCKRGGSVYVYKRVQRYKWLQKGSLLLPSSTTGIQGIQNEEEDDKDNNGITKKKKNMIMIKNKKPTSKKFGKIVAVKGNIVVVSDHHTQDETCISVFECNASAPSSSSLPSSSTCTPTSSSPASSLSNKKWNLLHENLLTDGQCRNFGSTLALTDEGGILVGCNAKVNPTEVLYFCKSADNKYGASVGGHGTYQLQQVISISEKSNKRNASTEDISDFKVDGNKFILGTSCGGGGGGQHCVYIYELQQDINQWMLLAKVDDPTIEKFGNSVALSGGKVLIGAKTNAYSYQLDGMVRKKHSKRSIFSGSKRNTVKSSIDDVTLANHESGYAQEPCSGLELLDLRSRSQKLLLQQQAQQRGVGGSNSSLSSSRLSLSLNRPKPNGWSLLRSRMRSQSPMREERSPSNTLPIGRMSSPSPMRRK